MGKLAKGLVLASSSLAFVALYNALMLGATATIVVVLKHWVIMVYAVWTLLGTAFGLKFGGLVFGPPKSGRLFTFDPVRFEQPFWRSLRRRGIVPLAVLATWAGSAIVAALLIRSLGLSDRRAWKVALAADLIVVGVTALALLGVVRLF